MNNRFLQDTSLSLQAKGLLAEILSNKSDWRIYLTELEKRSTNGASSHRAAFSELKHKKYAALLMTVGMCSQHLATISGLIVCTMAIGPLFMPS